MPWTRISQVSHSATVRERQWAHPDTTAKEGSGEEELKLSGIMLKSTAMGSDLEVEHSYIQLAFLGPLRCARCYWALRTLW